MRTGVLSLGLFCLVNVAEVRADEGPQALIDRAMKAVGGEAQLTQARSVQLKVKGTIHSDNEAIPFTAVILSQLPGRYRHAMTYERGGQRATQTQIYHDNKVSIRVDDRLFHPDGPVRESLLVGRYVEHLCSLTILKDKTYELSLAGGEKVGGKPALTVKVAAKDRPETRMFFDQESGLLVKTEHRQLDPRTHQEIKQEMFYSDYRESDTTARDEQTLKAARLAVDGPALLDYFRKLARQSVRDRVLLLIKQLGDDAFEVREKAVTDLLALGASAVPFLQDALKDDDLEVVRRAERCLKAIGKETNQSVPAAAIRLLAVRKPDGAVAVLLDYLPAAGESIGGEIRAALAALAFTDGQPDKTLHAALSDKDPIKRTAAAEALGRTPIMQPGRKILLPGLKRPMKCSIYRAGRIFMEYEVLDVAYFNKLEDTLFDDATRR